MKNKEDTIIGEELMNITIRQSIMMVIPKIVVLELTLTIINLSFIFLFKFLSSNSIDLNWMNINFWLTVAIQVLNIYFLIRIFLQWFETYYIITPSKVIIKNGIISITDQELNIKHLETFTVEQGVFGKLFHYGNIKIYNAVAREYFYMYNVPSPFKYLEILESLAMSTDEITRYYAYYNADKASPNRN